MFKCSSINGEMNPEAKKCLDRYALQCKFRDMYPDKAKAIQGMTVPSYDTIEELIAFADEKIRNQKIKLDQEKRLRESMGAPTKFDRYGHYKY